MSLFICPVCNKQLVKGEKVFFCADGHSFDISKYGYVNLLMSQKSSGKRHGDDTAMVKARRDFLEKGFYKPLRDEIIKSVSENAEKSSFIADIGCGEGYYTSALCNSYTNVCGIDISKDALRYASKALKQYEFSVASAFDLPFSDNSADVLLNIFAPSPYGEFKRVLKPEGVLIKAVPLEDHLWELKCAVYDEPYKNKPEKKDDELFCLASFKELKYKIDLNSSEDILNLFKMTPYYYKTGRRETERLMSLNALSTTVHFGVEVYKLK